MSSFQPGDWVRDIGKKSEGEGDVGVVFQVLLEKERLDCYWALPIYERFGEIDITEAEPIEKEMSAVLELAYPEAQREVRQRRIENGLET